LKNRNGRKKDKNVKQENLSKPNTFGTEEFVRFRQVIGLHKFKLNRYLVDETVKSVGIRQVFGLLRVRFRQVSLYCVFWVRL